MTDISTNKQIRRQQFRAIAKNTFQRDKYRGWNTDRVGDLARELERAYAAGAANAFLPEERPDAAGFIRWDAIPERSQAILQHAGSLIRGYVKEVREKRVLVALENAAARSARGERTWLSLWTVSDRELLRIETKDGVYPYDYAASSASALVKLLIFEPFTLESEEPFAVLTDLGLATLEAAERNEDVIF